MRVARSPLVLVTSFLISSQSHAQAPNAEARRPTPQPVHEIIIYRDRNYSGPAVSIRQDESNLRLVWTVNSARVHSGTWQLCERANFQGPCLTLSRSESNLGHRRVQSVRLSQRAWRELGRTNVFRLGWINTTIDVRDHPVMPEIRLCAESTAIRLHHGRVRFTNGLFQTLRLPSQINSGQCSDPIAITGNRRNLRTIEVTASSVGVARGRLRLEGR
jgi:hypothetical protein